jgi:regulatory protein
VRRGAEVVLRFAPALELRLLAEVAFGAGLHVGVFLAEADLRRMLAADESARARASALRMLTRRPRAARDLRMRLSQRGFSTAAATEAVARLQASGLVDDAAFAERYVELRRARPRSRRLLLRELQAKGVATETARDAVVGEDDLALAEDAARSKVATLAGLDRDTFYRRLGSFLQRRGFDYETSRSVVERCLREHLGAKDG